MNKDFVLGVDLGGTNTKIGLVNRQGTVLAISTFKTQDFPEVKDFIQTLAAHCKELVSYHNLQGNIDGIGIGAPNANYFNGCIEYAANLPWKGLVPMAELISAALGIPARINNDAKAAAMGERMYGVARGMDDFIMITLGTGVGSGIYTQGKLLYGHSGLAGELGHVIVEKNGRLCGCGRHGCLETYTSATGVARTVRELLEKFDEPSVLRKLSADSLTSFDVYEAALAGDSIAKQVFAISGRILGEALANFVPFSEPEAFVLFGGLTKAGNMLLEPVVEAMEENLMPVYKGRVKVLFSKFEGANAAILGASAFAWDL
jgi:glucokinase